MQAGSITQPSFWDSQNSDMSVPADQLFMFDRVLSESTLCMIMDGIYLCTLAWRIEDNIECRVHTGCIASNINLC